MTGNDGAATHTASVARQPPVSPQPQSQQPQLQRSQQQSEYACVGPTGPVPIIIPADKTPRIPHRNDENSVVLREMECALERYYQYGAQKHGELQLRDDGQYVLFQLPKPKEIPFEKVTDDDQQPAGLGAEEVLNDLMHIFLMDEDLGYVTFSPPQSERLHIPVEMPAEQLASVAYEDLIPPGVRSRRSGNERVHPSELRTPQGDARRARQERQVLFEMELSDADDEAEDEQPSSSSESASDDDDDSGVDAANVEEPASSGANFTSSAPTSAHPPRRSLFTRQTCIVPAHAFRGYRMARREMEHMRELAMDPSGPRALDDEEFEELVYHLGIDDAKTEDNVVNKNENEENFDPEKPSTSST